MVKADSGPVQGAHVTVGGKAAKTGQNGVAILVADFGSVNITVEKEGFFPIHTSQTIDSAREWDVEIELQPKEAEEQEVRVYATRTDVRMQDTPLHIEVIAEDEINEELAMRPGDISMMLNEMRGMRVQTTSPGLGAASLRLQGMRGR